jgi:hypothetical protein
MVSLTRCHARNHFSMHESFQHIYKTEFGLMWGIAEWLYSSEYNGVLLMKPAWTN